MAHLCPTLPHHSALNAGAYAELELLQTLERGLSDAYTLFHSVDWSRGAGAKEQHGEIDIVVVNQGGAVLLMEVKAGEVEFAPDGIYKSYGARAKNVVAQVGLQYGAMRQRLNDAQLPVHLSHLLVLPNFRVQSETAQWPRERIVDCDDITNIVSRVGLLLGPGARDDNTVERVLAFFQNKFRVEPDVSALAGRLQQAATRMSAGLATWVPRMAVPSGVIRVVGTAGSGKTQLAMRLLRDADAAGLKAAYICFNRALADHMARVAPVRATAETFHEFALHVARQSGQVIDFSQPAAFETIASHAIAALATRDPDLDLLVLDEVQDLQPEWVQAMLSRLRPEGRALLLEDPQQQLYADREPFDIPDAVTVTSNENFRTPRALVRLINLLRLTTTEVEPLSAHEGELPDPIAYETPEKIAPCTVKAVERCLARGFALHDIAIVSLRGRERSALQSLAKLGPWTLRHFTGHYDEGGCAIWTDGELLIESVRRFKGQAAAAVVLTECDIAELDAMNRRLLFVGLTRARVHLEWVVSERTAGMLRQTLQGLN
ncbi:MAG: AAA family ATPase [Betaproteobacteria bacterium]